MAIHGSDPVLRPAVPPKERERTDLATLDQLTACVLILRPGDILVMRSSTALTIDQARKYEALLRTLLDRAGHPGVPVAILQPELSIEIVRPGESG